MNAWNLIAAPHPAAARPVPRAGASIGAAVLIHAAIVWGLVTLNARPVPERAPELPVRTILLAADRAAAPPPPKPQTQEPPPPQLEPLTIDLDAPPPPTIEPIDMQLDLPTPTLSPIHVAVRPQPAPAPPRPAAPAPAPAEAPAALSGPMEADQVDQQPREMPDNPQPRYPQRERRLGVEASVTVRILIDTQGRVEDVQLISGPAAFADTVVATVRRWRFTPARDRGRPVKVWGVKTFRFELQE